MPIPNFDTAVYDAALNVIKNSCTQVVALSAEAASYTEATTNLGSGAGKRLASVTVVTGDFTVQAGATGVVRELAFAGKAGGSGLVAGDPVVFAFLDVAGSRILAQTAENGAVSIAPGSTVAFSAVKVMQMGTPTSA